MTPLPDPETSGTQLLTIPPNLFVEFDEPVTYTVTYSTPGGNALQHRQLDPVRKGTVMLQAMQPSSPLAPNQYSGSIVVTDLAQRSATYSIPAQTTRNAIPSFVPAGVVRNLTWIVSPNRSGGTLTGSILVDIDPVLQNTGVNFSGVQVLLQVLTRFPNQAVWTAKDAMDLVNPVSQVTFDSPVPGFHDGPFLVSPLTDANGQATVPVTINNLVVTEQVRVKVVAVLLPTATANQNFGFSVDAYQMPATLPEFRTLDE